MDVLVMQNILLFKDDQIESEQNENWKQEFELD